MGGQAASDSWVVLNKCVGHSFPVVLGMGHGEREGGSQRWERGVVVTIVAIYGGDVCLTLAFCIHPVLNDPP